MRDSQLFIGGQWINTQSGSVEKNLNPADGQSIGTVQLAGPREVKSAIAAAQEAFPRWAAMPATERQKYLLRAADHLEKNIDR